MRRLRKLLASSPRFKWLLAEALIRLCSATVVRLLPLPRRAHSLIRAHRVALQPPRSQPSSEEICNAVEIAGRLIPCVTCLVKAYVCSAMLNRFGYAAEIKIGVLKHPSNLEAHAWVEYDGRVVMGN